MADEDGDFLSRWSRRKRADAQEDEQTPPGPDPGPSPPVEPVPDEEEEDEETLLERLGLPAPETLKEGDDFTGFMGDGVPEFLRRRALRVLWRSNPVLANLDGLNDYDDDFRSPELTQKVLATGYQVGRGFVKKVLEGDPDPNIDPVEEPDPETSFEDREIPEIAEKPEVGEDAPEALEDDETSSPRPRRMRFET